MYIHLWYNNTCILLISYNKYFEYFLKLFIKTPRSGTNIETFG